MNATTILIWGMLAAASSAPVAVFGQALDGGRLQSTMSSRASTTTARHPDSQINCDCGSAGYPMPQITVAAPPPVQASWPLHDRVAWGANLILVLSAYIAIWMALAMLKKIQSQAKDIEKAIAAAATTAEAALHHTQAIIRGERPWITITAEPYPDRDDTSRVVATNRGRSPARIVALADKIISAVDESHLPARPDYGPEERGTMPAPMILLPGESTAIKTFGPDDITQSCTEETLKRVEEWCEKLFLYGRVRYEDLNAPDGKQMHETTWCCWYIYGQKRSGLVTMGSPEYTKLT